MRSYGDKPADFMRLVPSGLLPAIVVETEGGKQVITESQVRVEIDLVLIIGNTISDWSFITKFTTFQF